MSHLRLIVAAALALVLVLPATALAATFDVGGTVTNTDGSPAVGAEITILVQGTDQIVATTTDENGAWALQLDAEPGAVLEVNGTGQSTSTEPDADGCTTTTTPSGQVNATIPAEGTVPAIDFPLDNPLTGTVCATATPPDTGGGNGGGGNGGGGEAPAEQQPDTAGVTPPSTDTLPVAKGSTTAGNATFLVLGVLVGLTGAVARPDRPPAAGPPLGSGARALDPARAAGDAAHPQAVIQLHDVRASPRDEPPAIVRLEERGRIRRRHPRPRPAAPDPRRPSGRRCRARSRSPRGCRCRRRSPVHRGPRTRARRSDRAWPLTRPSGAHRRSAPAGPPPSRAR